MPPRPSSAIIRYRSASTAPGRNRLSFAVQEEGTLVRDDEDVREGAGIATVSSITAGATVRSPHDRQKRLLSGISVPHLPHFVMHYSGWANAAFRTQDYSSRRVLSISSRMASRGVLRPRRIKSIWAVIGRSTLYF